MVAASYRDALVAPGMVAAKTFGLGGPEPEVVNFTGEPMVLQSNWLGSVRRPVMLEQPVDVYSGFLGSGRKAPFDAHRQPLLTDPPSWAPTDAHRPAPLPPPVPLAPQAEEGVMPVLTLVRSPGGSWQWRWYSLPAETLQQAVPQHPVAEDGVTGGGPVDDGTEGQAPEYPAASQAQALQMQKEWEDLHRLHGHDSATAAVRAASSTNSADFHEAASLPSAEDSGCGVVEAQASSPSTTTQPLSHSYSYAIARVDGRLQAVEKETVCQDGGCTSISRRTSPEQQPETDSLSAAANGSMPVPSVAGDQPSLAEAWLPTARGGLLGVDQQGLHANSEKQMAPGVLAAPVQLGKSLRLGLGRFRTELGQLVPSWAQTLNAEHCFGARKSQASVLGPRSTWGRGYVREYVTDEMGQRKVYDAEVSCDAEGCKEVTRRIDMVPDESSREPLPTQTQGQRSRVQLYTPAARETLAPHVDFQPTQQQEQAATEGDLGRDSGQPADLQGMPGSPQNQQKSSLHVAGHIGVANQPMAELGAAERAVDFDSGEDATAGGLGRSPAVA